MSPLLISLYSFVVFPSFPDMTDGVDPGAIPDPGAVPDPPAAPVVLSPEVEARIEEAVMAVLRRVTPTTSSSAPPVTG